MQNQMVKSKVVISGSYLLIGIIIREIWEVNDIKSGESISHLVEFNIVVFYETNL